MDTLKRREFLKKSAAAAFGFTILPSYLASARAVGATLPPSQRVNLACIGVGGRARAVIPSLVKGGLAEVVALCDVDFESSARGLKENLERFPKARRFQDFRVMLEKMGDDIDAVSIVTPDHTHFPAAMLAISMGKHVYVEKPLTHNFEESEQLMRADKRFGVVTQMGNQGHTSAGHTQFQQLVKAGLTHDLDKMEVYKSASLWFMKEGERISEFPKAAEVPSTLDWEGWCGPRVKMPYNPLYQPFNWRGFYHYGCGMLGDWGCHLIDFAHHFLKLGLPTHIEPLRLDDHNQVIFPLTSHLKFQFPKRGRGLPAMELIWRDGADCVPQVQEQYWDKKSDGTPVAPSLGKAGSVLYRKNGDFAITRGSHGAVSRIIPREKMLENREHMRAPEPKNDHFISFIEACRGNGTTNSPFSVAGELTQVLNLGVICQYLNTELKFDPKKKRFTGNDAANAMLNPAPRKGWEEFYRMV